MGLKPKAIARVGNRFILVPFPSLLGSATAPPEIPSGPPSPSWTLDFSSGEPWSNGTNYVFSSTASTSRTFVNSSGYVAPCVANLVVQSQTFDTSWVPSQLRAFGSGSTANAATAPDNTTTADLITENNVTGDHGIGWLWASGPSTANQRICCSVFAKKPTSNAREVIGVGGIQDGIGYFGKRFNLTTGAAVGADYNTNTSTFTNLQSGIEDYGNGWYRCWCSVQTSSTAQCGHRIAMMVNSTTTYSFGYGSYAGDNTSGLLIWGAQMEYGVTQPSSYSRTTTSSNGIPRLTHNSSGSRLGLLVEGQRTNYARASQDFTNTTWWPPGFATVTANSGTSPDGTNNAFLITDVVGFSTHSIGGANIGSMPTTALTASVYVKKPTSGGSDYAFVQMFFNGSPNTTGWGIVDLTTGAITATSAGGFTNFSATAVDTGNGWWRMSITGTPAAGGSIGRIWVGPSSSTNPTYNTPAGGPFKSILAWGAQFENSARETSYIPTTTASVTRSADLAYVETADVTNWGRPGSFVVEYYPPQEQSGTIVVADDDGVGSVGRLGVEYSSGGPRIVYGTASTGTGGTPTAGLQKIAWAWDASGAATRSALNGSALDNSLATSFTPSATDGINLGGNIDWTSIPLTVSGQPNVVIRRVRFWNSQLSAADLNTLTT